MGEVRPPLAERVSVVLLTYNCAHRIETVLDHLMTLGVPIIAVDNGSVDDTAAVLDNYPRVEVIRLGVNRGAVGRNVGAERVRTPYVAFCDDDGWYEPEGLLIAADALDAYPELALVNARILVTEEEYLDPISAEMADSPLVDRHGIPGAVLLGFMGGACIVRLSAYRDVGGYDAMYFMGGEEQTLALKLARNGWQLRYRADVVVQHRPSQANASALVAYGLRNALWTCWLHRRPFNAVRASAQLLRDRPKGAAWVQGLLLAVGGLPRILAQRQGVPEELDRDLRRLDSHRSRHRMQWDQHVGQRRQ